MLLHHALLKITGYLKFEEIYDYTLAYHWRKERKLIIVVYIIKFSYLFCCRLFKSKTFYEIN